MNCTYMYGKHPHMRVTKTLSHVFFIIDIAIKIREIRLDKIILGDTQL